MLQVTRDSSDVYFSSEMYEFDVEMQRKGKCWFSVMGGMNLNVFTPVCVLCLLLVETWFRNVLIEHLRQLGGTLNSCRETRKKTQSGISRGKSSEVSGLPGTFRRWGTAVVSQVGRKVIDPTG